ncbi:hypothetical protein RHGRI_004030 [Rhododendron griersonianum]|uniref:Protein kinase domain-containing protein n=1 Tax=Rhododendron griersonianum TaxID=479676 RepID=A0AAV6L838_9ERIC|nr:hypothetical protein RHGRI_004028 [Rhododendron griersonianum]KAG5560870.1 hypothetical protein RHGRI_004030 [Rhododendron griersonianum]
MEHPALVLAIDTEMRTSKKNWLPVGQSLVSAIADRKLSMGDYRLTVIDDGCGDAVMTWNGLTYWMLSMDTRAYKVSNLPASYMVLNETGLFLFGGNSSVVVIQLTLNVSQFRIARLEYDGRFSIMTFNSSNWVEEFGAPDDYCGIPDICDIISILDKWNGYEIKKEEGDRVELDADKEVVKEVANQVDDTKIETDVGDQVIEDQNNCTLEVVDTNISELHSSKMDGCYKEALQVATVERVDDDIDKPKEEKSIEFIVNSTTTVDEQYSLEAIQLSTIGVHVPLEKDTLMAGNNFLDTKLVAATENFRAKIGSGGFGTVNKGTLPDESAVAMKKITSLGVEGKREFCTEIAIIGNIRHVNLVRLKGFCIQGRQRFLVYEYMNKEKKVDTPCVSEIVMERNRSDVVDI